MFFRRSPKIKGYISYFKLVDWWQSLTDTQREGIRSNYGGINTDPSDITEADIKYTSMSAQGFLCEVAGNASRKKEYRHLAEMLALKALTVQGTAIDRHLVYNILIDLLYKQRSEREDAIDLCLKYCLEDIDQIDQFAKEWQQSWKEVYRDSSKVVDLPDSIPSFGRAIKIYEDRDDLESALKVCQKAIKVGHYDKSEADKIREKFNKRSQRKR